MRLILKIVDFNNQKSIKKINFSSIQNKTDDLLKEIQKILKIQASQFIVTLIKNITRNQKFRITPNWSLQHYRLAQGDQLDIKIIKTQQQRNIGQLSFNAKNQKIFNLQGLSQNCQTITQQKQDEQDQLVKAQKQQTNTCMKTLDKKHEKVLKVIQRSGIDQFFQAMRFSQVQGQCERAYMKQKLQKILNQLGDAGWAAIHFSVYFKKVQILEELIKLNVDINKKTTDQWLPIQLAINDFSLAQLKQDEQILDILLSHPLIDLNLVTQKGSALHNALIVGNTKIVRRLLRKKSIDPFIKDLQGRTFEQVTNSQQCLKLLRQFKFIGQQYTKGYYNRNSSVQFSDDIASVYRGSVFEIRNFPLKSKQRYLVLKVSSAKVLFFSQKKDYPNNPKQVIPFSSIKKVQKIKKQANQKSESIFSKIGIVKENQFYCFQLVHKKDKKIIFGCNFNDTVQKWLDAFNKCISMVKTLQSNPQYFQYKKSNQITIMDRRQIPRNSLTQSPESPKRKYGNIMELFLSGSCQKQKNQDKKQEENENILNSAKSQNTSDTNSSGGQTNNNTNIKLTQKDMQAIRKSVIIDHEESIKPKYKDFKIMTLLGEGSFGSVYLATHIKSKKKFALKVLQKKKMIIQKQVRFAASQINILKQIDHPFTMNLKFTFQTANYIYLGLDYCQGKDLAYHLVKQCNFNQNQSKFYVAQILLALQHLHSKNILYRDMKPDNILLDCDGHIKITDFGLSKQCNDNRQVAKSFCGSPAYLSPEMVSKKGASKATDFYGLGAVLYQLLVGQPPFYDQNIKILYQNITQGKLKFPKILSPNAKSLLSGLLQKNPQKRLGWNGIDQIKNHPFFASINWEKLLKKQIKPPIRPSIQQIKLKNKQQCQQLQFISNILHNDHDYQQNKTRTNRFLNFSFFRQDCFQKQE